MYSCSFQTTMGRAAFPNFSVFDAWNLRRSVDSRCKRSGIDAFYNDNLWMYHTLSWGLLFARTTSPLLRLLSNNQNMDFLSPNVPRAPKLHTAKKTPSETVWIFTPSLKSLQIYGCSLLFSSLLVYFSFVIYFTGLSEFQIYIISTICCCKKWKALLVWSLVAFSCLVFTKYSHLLPNPAQQN